MSTLMVATKELRSWLGLPHHIASPCVVEWAVPVMRCAELCRLHPHASAQVRLLGRT